MTTYFNFIPNDQTAFTFQPILDGRAYQASVTWNLFGQRYYLNVRQLTGELVFSLPLLGSASGFGIESITWSNGVVEVNTTTPLGFQIGTTVPLTVSNCLPVEYNGVWNVQIIDDDRFTFALTGDPGDATQLGRAIYDIDIAAGYFTTSTLIYRADNAVFEVNP